MDNRIFLSFLLILSLLAVCIEVEISVPSFPDMARYFNVSEREIQLTIAFNLFGDCLAAFLYGPLSDAYGRRKVMIFGNLLMVVGSISCVFANEINFLYLARFIQGIGAATSAVVVFAILADIYYGQESLKIIGIFNAIFSTSMAIAPLLGGFLNESFGWRGNYGFVAIITIISWLGILFGLTETNHNLQKFAFKKIFGDYFKLLANKNFIYSSMVPSLSYGGYISFIACAPFLYMEHFSMSMVGYIANQAFMVGLFAITSIYANDINAFLGTKIAVFGSLIMMIAGTILMLLAGIIDNNLPYLVTFAMSIDSFASAILYPIIFNHSMSIYPSKKGIASSLIMSMRTLLMALMVAITSYVFDGSVISIAIVLSINVFMMIYLTLSLIKQDAKLLLYI